MKKKSLTFIVTIVLMLIPGCGKADKGVKFSIPETVVEFANWKSSGSIQFKVTKISQQDSLTTSAYPEARTQKAPAGKKFVLVNIDVMPAQKGEAWVDFSSCSILNKNGAGYKLNLTRYSYLNGEECGVKIKSGYFIARRLPFLVNENFTPSYLRCLGSGDDAQPVFLKLTNN